MPSFEERVAVKLARLEAWCLDNGVTVSAAGEVDEASACALLSYTSRDALRHQAAEGRLSPVLRRRRCGPRWLYELESIAEEIVLAYERNAVS
ncbi:hypothetical protein CBA19CS22_36865 [Caballeronia novacaledonica]|uniref:Uncharacterized protein n=1 Tax=Caballeronia novacaledonica TaxID=1544861 RepID=A0ACB5R5J4_9BURK|nr:hypothetical protein CBA19CS22_36865 [Caballeronia novacaledonica]